MGETSFNIKLSRNEGEQTADISPDVATCPDCLEDIFDSANPTLWLSLHQLHKLRPRYSIIGSLPYDRPKTTMVDFPMCPDCQHEYDDPLDRRFHAQPNACHTCGPELKLLDNQGEEISGDPIKNLANMLRGGMIAAIKGLGGFHLACPADNEESVQRLRERKGREAKPFAIMVGKLKNVEEIALLDDLAKEAMEHWSRPIVLLPRKLDSGIAASVAPATSSLGIMLPYTPFHHLLFQEYQGPLVMTSGNPSSEPLCSDNDEAIERLKEIADVFLMHNRRIQRKVDDSVALSLRLAEDESLVTPCAEPEVCSSTNIFKNGNGNTSTGFGR
jgi:hydrogenase maturation protein HypF